MPDGATTGTVPGDGHPVIDAAVGIGTQRVRGTIRGVDGTALAGVGVVAYAQRLRQADTVLGKAGTAADGTYSISYRAPSPRVDLVVRGAHNGTSAASPVIIGAGPDETIDLVLGGAYIGPSDHAQLHLSIAPALAEAGAASVADFTEAEIATLSAKSGADPTDLVLLRQAAALSAKTKLSTELFYALGRQRVPLTFAGVMTTDPKRRRDAVAAALAANQVPPALAKQLEDEAGKLDQLAVQEALRGPITPGESTLGSLMGTAGLSTAQQAQLIGLHIAAGGDATTFWKTVREKNVLAAAQIDQVQDTLRVNALVLGHVPLVQALHAKQLTRPVDLATLERADWQALVSGAGVPPDLVAAGVTPTQYVDQIVGLVEEAVPTARIAARASHLPGAANLSQFLATNPSFDIRGMAVAAYLRTNPNALNFLPDEGARATFTAQLKGIERVYRIAPLGARLHTMEIVLAAGITSAQQIRMMGKAAFLRRFGNALGAEQAAKTWARASTSAAVATTLIAQHGAAFEGPTMRVLPARADAVQGLTAYAALFGSPDTCACSDCQSLGSPAAYLVDTLHWLDARATTGGTGTALDVLLDPARRADLGTIELSCANTSTPMPQIDLAIELLELAVAQPTSTPSYQTRAAADDLRVQPEHQLAPAYTVLAGADSTKDAVYPWTLPYDLWLDEARTYVGQLGVSRADLMTTLHDGGHDAALADPAVAAELFAMSPLEWDVVAGKPLAPSRAPATFWGLDADPSWDKTLVIVSTLCARAMPDTTRDAAYAALTDWLRTDYVQAAGALGLSFADASCDTTKATLTGLTAAHLDRIHRFARLQRRLGWTAADLDRAIAVLGGGVLDEACLVKLAVVRRLVTTLGSASLAEILTWWGPLDTRRWVGRLAPQGNGFVFTRDLAPIATDGEDQSFYDARFLTRSVGAAPDLAFRVAIDGNKLLDETQPLADHAAPIAAALGVTAADLAALAPLLPSDRLTLANLSQLFRHVSLARAVGLTVPNLERLLALSGATPFDLAAPAGAIVFLDEVRAARAARVSFDELEYLLRDVDTQPPTLAPSDTAIGVVLLAMRDALRRVPVDQPDASQQPAAARSVVVDTLGAALGLSPAVIAPLLETYVRSPVDDTTHALAVFLDPQLTKYQVVDPVTGAQVVPTPADLPAAFATYRRLHKVALLVTRLRIGADELPWVCETGPKTGTLDVNTLPTSPAAPLASYAAWVRLRDAIALRDGLPGKQLFDLFTAAAQATGDPATIAAAYAALLDALVARTRWTRADVETLVGTPAENGQPPRPSALGLAYPADWTSERGFARVTRAMAAITRVGLAADTVWPWRQIPAAIDERQTQATTIRQAVRARYPDATQWRQVARPLRDALRERQRDALCAWLCAHDDRFHSADDLYGHLLIDVLISPCQLTSRLRQAMASAQQFVQRALLGSEPEVALTVADAAEWTTWRKTYRMWEANRKVFLYPENWIDPSLRDDKTPLFRALEDTLAQSDVTAEAAEAAVTAYLQALDELARLEVVGVLHQKDDAGDVLHVFARTRNTPTRYFYRQRVSGVRWTPWQAMNVDIEGDHLVPVIFQGRLYVFWAQFSVAAVESDVVRTPTPGTTTAAAPQRYYQIRLAWSQYRDGTWLGRTLSTAQVGATGADYDNYNALGKTADSTPADFFFRTFEDAGDLVIEPIRRWVSQRAHDVAPPTYYYRIKRFRLSGCDGTLRLEDVIITADPTSWRLPLVMPPGTLPANQSFASADGASALSLPAQNATTSALEDDVALAHIDGAFAIVPAHVDEFHSEDVFFVQDRRRTFHVAPGVRHWFRPPAQWLQPDGISIEPLKLYAETKRPLVPRPDPWLLDRVSVARVPAPIRTSAPPALIASNGAAVAGLPADGVNALAETLGARVASIGGETVTPRSPALALVGQTDIFSASGQLLVSVRSAGTPSAASGLRVLTIDSSYTVPPLEVADPVMGAVLTSWDTVAFRFEEFYHPYVCRMLRQIQRFGIDGLLDPAPDGPEPLLRRQQLADDYFIAGYGPTQALAPYPRDEIDFSYGGAFAAYNWEVFFHIPFAIACRLSANQQFADAQRWFHYIFDPTARDGDPSTLARCWKFRPFFELWAGESADVGPIADLLLLLSDPGTDSARAARRDELLAQIAAWRAQPFDPDAVARLRIVAYAKAVVVRYIENLIAWGDQLFTQDTLETVEEATQLYVLADQILGPRPATIAMPPPAPATFEQMRAHVDELGDIQVEEIEGYLPDVGDPPPDDDAGQGAPSPLGPLYFCVPPNDMLARDTWDKVADRLFKIRHCLDITGRPQQLALFEPPIDPGLLVRAQAAGIDLASALRDVTAPLPIHRYAVLASKASELTAEVRGLGQAMLAALEKQDGEALALLRADHEVKLSSAMRQVRQRQVDDANATLDGLRSARDAADARVQYYRSREFMNAQEKAHQKLSTDAGTSDHRAGVTQLIASWVGQLPDFSTGVAGAGGSPYVTMSIGGGQASRAVGAVAEGFATDARSSDRQATLAATLASYQRRADDWQLQGDVAEKDRDALDKQILGAEIRVAIAARELANLDLQIDQAHEVADQLRSKYTNQELYTWMVGQLSSLYFQGYQLAYQVAKRAEKAWRFELAQPDTSFIEFGYWDSLKKGLLAGERLAHDLRRMDVAYLDQHVREYELTRAVSLKLLAPAAVEQLKTTGACDVTVPEFWYDLDSPGHYLRRIKTVAVSLPCVGGAYVPVRCTLTLTSSSVRTSDDPSDPRFHDVQFAIQQAIVTSRADEDAGLFETNLRDERYLPFEGAGAISTWHLELPTQFRPFDYDTITDLVLHIRYTARQGAAELRKAAEGALLPMLQGLALGVSLREEMADGFEEFLHPEPDQTDQQVTISLDKERFPFFLRGNAIAIAGIDVFLPLDDLAGYGTGAPVRLEVTAPGGAAQPIELKSGPDFAGVPHGSVSLAQPAALGDWTLAFVEADNASASGTVVTPANGHRRLIPEAVRDVIVIVRYQVA